MRWKGKEKKDSNKKPTNNGNSYSILVPEVIPKAKRRPFISLFDKEVNTNINESKKVKKQWRVEGFTKWRKSNVGEEECTSSLVDCTIVASPVGEGHDKEGIEKEIHSDASFWNIKKKEITLIRSELSSNHSNLNSLDPCLDGGVPLYKAEVCVMICKPCRVLPWKLFTHMMYCKTLLPLLK